MDKKFSPLYIHIYIHTHTHTFMAVETVLFIVLWSLIIIAVFSVAYIFLFDTNSVEDSTKGTFEPKAGSPGASPGASEEVIPKTSPKPRPEEPKKKRPKASSEESTKTRTKTGPWARPKASSGVAGGAAEGESAELGLSKRAAAVAGVTLVGGGTALSLREVYKNLYGQEFPSNGPEEDPPRPIGEGGPTTLVPVLGSSATSPALLWVRMLV